MSGHMQTKEEKIEFVHKLTAVIVEDIERAIESERVPAGWDGIELRQLLADKFAEQVFGLEGKRKRAYTNTVKVNCL